eukprot:scaffold9626_cov124-Skeletonema_dohrnii-CCMP3373.AAC.4
MSTATNSLCSGHILYLPYITPLPDLKTQFLLFEVALLHLLQSSFTSCGCPASYIFNVSSEENN